MDAAQPPALMGFIPILFMIGIFYVLLIRPQQKQMKEHKKMLDDLRKGDKVLTNGGIYGTVVNIKGPDLDLKIADNVKVQVARSAISKLVSDPELVSSGRPGGKN